jgi:hypothetical protein
MQSTRRCVVVQIKLIEETYQAIVSRAKAPKAIPFRLVFRPDLAPHFKALSIG